MPPDIGTEPSTARARELLARWASIRDLLARTERRDLDRLLVAHDHDEMTLIWEREKLALIFAPPDERPQPRATPR